MKKGIAIRTILLILIGVIIVGIMAYLIYRAAGTKAISMYECKAKLIDICRICKNTNWDNDYPLDAGSNNLYDTVMVPCSGYSEFFYWSDNRCCGEDLATCGNMPWDCGALGFE